MELQFEWDEQKNLANIAKHGVDFNDAAKVFADPSRLERLDDGDHGEERWQTLGVVHFGVLFVVYTERRDGVIRIITARQATRREEKAYRSGRF